MNTQKKIIDLHCHTTASDGLDSPTRLVEKASESGLDVIAITDHDSVMGVDEGLKAGQTFGVEVIPGIELSTIHDGKEFHLLGYLFDYKNQNFHERLFEISSGREARAQKIIEILNKTGYVIDYSELRETVKGNIGKPHIAREILSIADNKIQLESVFGKIPTISEFIQYYMIEGKIANVPKKRLETVEGISLIKELGGVSVLAHPGYDLYQNKNERDILAHLKRAGLNGIEVYYFVKDASLTRECIAHYEELAQELDLLKTGGSDYHGEGQLEGVMLGLKNTDFLVPYDLLIALKNKKTEN